MPLIYIPVSLLLGYCYYYYLRMLCVFMYLTFSTLSLLCFRKPNSKLCVPMDL